MTTVAEAVKTLTEALEGDRDYFYGWQANMAMAFKDEYARSHKKYKNQRDIHEIANLAARGFLNRLIWLSDQDEVAEDVSEENKENKSDVPSLHRLIRV